MDSFLLLVLVIFLKFADTTTKWWNAVAIQSPKDIEFTLRFKLRRLEQYAEFARDKNLNFNKVIKKIAFVYDKDFAQSQGAFWWNDILEWEWTDVSPNATIRWRSSYL